MSKVNSPGWRLLPMLFAVVGIGLATTVPVLALDVCTHPEEESSFLCGEVFVELRTDAAATIEDVLASCEPVGEVRHLNDELLRPLYTIGVPVGREVALRDCYATHADVVDADLSAFGMLTPNTSMSVPSGGGNQVLQPWLGLMCGLTTAVATIAIQRTRSQDALRLHSGRDPGRGSQT